jgi:hypothetical protein
MKTARCSCGKEAASIGERCHQAALQDQEALIHSLQAKIRALTIAHDLLEESVLYHLQQAKATTSPRKRA